MNKQTDEIKELAEALRLIDELQYDPNYTLSYQRAMCLNKLGYRKASDVVRAVIDEINNAIPVKDFNSNEITTGYLWAIADVRKLLLKLKKKYESEE